MKIWQRYIFTQLIRTFIFLLFCFFLIYTIVDLSVHGVHFLSSEKSTFTDIALYYVYTFSVHLELFCMLVFLFTILKTLFDLNHHHELIALHMAGLSKKRLFFPFFILAGALTIVSYINIEYFTPSALAMAQTFRKACKDKPPPTAGLHSVYLQDDSELVYQTMDPTSNELLDVFWVKTPNDIWHMKSLSVATSTHGQYVDHFTRNNLDQLEKKESFAIREFPELPWDKTNLNHQFIPFENRPLSSLFSQSKKNCSGRSAILSHLFHKLITPLVPFLILLSVAPFCMKFSRKKNLFLITTLSLFTLISAKVILDGMLILGENQVLTPTVAVLGPFMIFASTSIISFLRMK